MNRRAILRALRKAAAGASDKARGVSWAGASGAVPGAMLGAGTAAGDIASGDYAEAGKKIATGAAIGAGLVGPMGLRGRKGMLRDYAGDMTRYPWKNGEAGFRDTIKRDAAKSAERMSAERAKRRAARTNNANPISVVDGEFERDALGAAKSSAPMAPDYNKALRAAGVRDPRMLSNEDYVAATKALDQDGERGLRMWLRNRGLGG